MTQVRAWLYVDSDAFVGQEGPSPGLVFKRIIFLSFFVHVCQSSAVHGKMLFEVINNELFNFLIFCLCELRLV